MRIIKHGNVYKFSCNVCGCQWEAGENECTPNIGYGIMCDCPDCGKSRLIKFADYEESRVKKDNEKRNQDNDV